MWIPLNTGVLEGLAVQRSFTFLQYLIYLLTHFSRISLTVMDEWAKTKNMKARTPKAKQNEDLKLKKIRQIKHHKNISLCNYI
jgi:hypothetical protein